MMKSKKLGDEPYRTTILDLYLKSCFQMSFSWYSGSTLVITNVIVVGLISPALWYRIESISG